ncbi:hypothetical protein [Luteipulveratus halotolerans]|uniref:Integral membrane protein n=1 Tax=Luteipulveratus halotolerans TaxID=1631356 RepID=A0A0L6CE05_9MICO|nr:hypothetical protein [Luteipulveratus halotolerans]KNX35919.1 hypothetical protein VV01_21935 [Luteipulveratus halotolerans]
MRLYARTRRTTVLYAVALLVGASSAMATPQVSFPTVIGSGGTTLPINAILPTVLGCAIAWSLSARFTHLTDNAARETGWLDVLLALGAVVVVAIGGLLVLAPDLVVLRNAVLTVGISVAGTAIFTPAAGSLLTASALIVSLTYGPTAPGARFARLFQAPSDQTWPWAISILALAVALAAAACRPWPHHQQVLL